MILTGFLGAGKTSLLRQILAAESFGRSAVLVNEFGEVGIDQHLVNAVSPDIVLLDSGCVCCQIRGELKDAMLGLLESRSQGAVPPFERIVIETTGLAEPAPIVSTVHADPVLQNNLYVDKIVTVVDALAAEATEQSRSEWLQQVAAADLLVISKTDLVPDRGQALAERLAKLNPEAEILPRRQEDDVPSALLAISESARAWDNRPPLPERHRGGHDHRHDNHVVSIVIEMGEVINWIAFGVWLSALLHMHGQHILRVKGVLDVGGDCPVLINGVQHMIFPPRHLDGVQPAIVQSRLVMIVDGIDPQKIRASFARYVLGQNRLAAAS